jgi:hypothetical protein
MHYSLALGALEAATMPDEQHPFGKAIPHEHHHSHEHHDSKQQGSAAQHENPGEFHDHHHNYGINIQLNMDLPVLVALDFHKAETHPITQLI